MNQYIEQRLTGIQQSLIATHTSTMSMSSAAKGSGRADFIAKFLSEVITPAYRIRSSADLTDSLGLKTGEVDIVIENGFSPSFVMPGADTARLHIAEGVGVVIEVKSNLKSQWSEVIKTSEMVGVIRRKFSGGTFGTHGTTSIHQIPIKSTNPNLPKMPFSPIHFALADRIPFFVVGYEGWSDNEILKEKIAESGGNINGILQIDKGYFCSDDVLVGITALGPWSLYGLLSCILRATSYTQYAIFNPLIYAGLDK